MSRSFTASSKYPTLRQVLFSPHTPYVPPRDSPLAMSVWRWRIWFESTFGLVSMEPWEKYTVGGFARGPTASASDMSAYVTPFFVPSGFLSPCFWLHGPRRSGRTQNAIHGNIRIQSRAPLRPRYVRATKQYLPGILRDTLESVSYHVIYSG